MSHEIRTPLNGMLGLTDALLGMKLNDEQRELAATARSSGRLLKSLLDDVLDYSKIDSGYLSIVPAPVDLDALCQELIKLWHELADDHGIVLEARRDPAVPRWVLHDERRLQQILGNLLSNALKFTDQGHIHLIVRTENDRLLL